MVRAALTEPQRWLQSRTLVSSLRWVQAHDSPRIASYNQPTVHVRRYGPGLFPQPHQDAECRQDGPGEDGDKVRNSRLDGRRPQEEVILRGGDAGERGVDKELHHHAVDQEA